MHICSSMALKVSKNRGAARVPTSDFGNRLRTLRVQKDLSQTDLGSAVDVHYTQIARYENGASKPSSDVIKLLAEVLGVSTDHLLYGKIENAAVAKMEDRELLQMFEEVEKFSPEEKAHIKYVLDNAIKNKKHAAVSQTQLAG